METNSGAVYYPSVSGALPGGVGTITFELQLPDSTIVTPASTVDIVENAPGSYTATRIAPAVDSRTTYKLVWRDSRNTFAPSDVSSLYVNAGPDGDAGIFYASYDAVRSYLGLTSDQLDDGAITQPLLRSQRDIDTGCGRWVAYSDTSLKFASSAPFAYPLTDLETLMLREATCAQVEFRMTVGDDFMIRGQYDRQRGGGDLTFGKLPKLCEAAYAKLGQGGFLKLHGRVERVHRGFLEDETDNLSLNRRVSDVHFGDLPRNVGLIPRV